jgi:hypothetical protein
MESDTPAPGSHHAVVRTELARSAEGSAERQGIELGALLRTIVVRRGEDPDGVAERRQATA